MKNIQLVFLGSLLVLFGCDSDNNTVAPPPPPPPLPAMASFSVSVDNLTNSQPLSPIAIILHRDNYSSFTVGMSATVGLEQLAEGGDNTALIAEADAVATVVATASGAAPIGPAGTETVTIEVLESDVADLRVSVITMLVNTNDAFTAMNGQTLASLAVGESLSTRTIAYDAGTEADTETGSHIPGPAGGGEGFNAARDDEADRVSMHGGVVSMNDGHPTSSLSEQHRFDNPVMRVLVTRTQ